MKQLPAGPVDPLHFPDPYPHPIWAALAALALLLLLWFLWRRRAQREPPAVPAPLMLINAVLSAVISRK